MDRRKEEETEDGGYWNIGKFIPLDLIPDILLKLPAKSAVRFRCVSKLWSSITTRPDFIRSFGIQSSTQLRLMVCVKTCYTRLFISLPQHEHLDDISYSHVLDRYEINSPPLDYYHGPFSESVQGLVCYGDYRNIVVWNPSMRQHVTLPEPEPRVKCISSCLGYDPVEGKYKVLCISGRKCKDPLVFTLGPQESWRLTKNSPLHIPTNTRVGDRIGVCVNGHVYYEANIFLDDTFEYEEDLLMSFHVRYEVFKTIEKPDDPTLCDLMLNYQGKLAWVCKIFTCLRFWVLEDEERQEWSLREFALPFPTYPQPDPFWDMPLFLMGVTHDTGEFIFARKTFEIFFVLYYDPKRERTRRIAYEGIGDKEFWIRNGINLDSSENIHWFLNHSESLMSLENVPCFVPTDSDSE